jgi:hypothetical protein
MNSKRSDLIERAAECLRWLHDDEAKKIICELLNVIVNEKTTYKCHSCGKAINQICHNCQKLWES